MADQYTETFETWDKLAQLYQDKFMDLDLYNETYDVFCNEIGNEKADILEIGCGPGNITRYILNRCPGFKIKAIDVSPQMIALANQNVPGADFSVMDCRKIGRLEGQYDAVIGGFCLPYLSMPDISKLLADVKKLLRNNGLLYFSFVEGDYSLSGYKMGSTGHRTYFYYYTTDDIERLLGSHGFKMTQKMAVEYLRETAAPEIHTIILARK